MIKRDKIRLGDIAVFSNGINFSLSEYEGDVKLIGVAHFGDRYSPDYDILDSISGSMVSPKDELQNGDILFVRSNGNKDLVGRSMLIKDIPGKVTFSGFCIRMRIKDTKRYNPAYFAYHFKTREFRKAISGNARGANIQNLNQQILSNYYFDVPDKAYQDYAVNILNNFGSLIENYQRQVSLCEEYAERLYREWFINKRISDIIGADRYNFNRLDWQKIGITEVFAFSYGKILPTKCLVEEGEIPVYGATKVIGYYTTPNCYGPTALVGSRGNAGFVHRTYEEKAYITNNSFIVKAQPEYSYITMPFIYEALKASNITSVCTGAAQPQLTLGSLSSLEFELPPKEIILRYIEITTPVFERINIAHKQVELLSESRERVLPFIISAES